MADITLTSGPASFQHMDNEQPKFCKDCALYGGGDICLRPHPEEFNLVTGEKKATRQASMERVWSATLSDSCGPEAVFWVTKTPVLPGGHHKCRRCGEVVEDGSDQDGCRDPDCPETGR